MTIYEKLRHSKHKNNNEMEKEMTVAELVRRLNKEIEINGGKPLDRNVVGRIENGSQKPTVTQLVAYSKVFDVSIDYILNNVSPKSDTETIKSIADYLGLSDTTIKEIKELKTEYKMILDKMISRYNLLSILYKIRNLLGYNYLQPHLKLLFDEKTSTNSGAKIDQYLIDEINDKDASTFFNSIVYDHIKQTVDNTMNDEELKEYFGKLDEQSKIHSILSAKDLPKLDNDKTKEGDDNKTSNPSYRKK